MNVGQQIEVGGQLYKVQRILGDGQYVLSPYDPARRLQNPQYVIDAEVPQTIVIDTA